jgi:outer membrane protein assembly factor BamB
LCLYRVNFDTGVPLWHFSLGEIGRWYSETDGQWKEGAIEHFVGVANGILWVNVVHGTILGIDANTGELKHSLTTPHKVVGNASQPHHQYPQGRLNYDEKRNILFGFHYDVFSEIDLNEPEPQLTFYIIEECSKQQAFSPNVDRYCYDEHYFYYLDAFNGKIGIIDRTTKKLIWVYSFSEASTSGILMKIEVSENYLFVLDSGGTLHIFEREE